MNRDKFFLAVRMDPVLFGGTLPASAVQTMGLTIDEFEKRELTIWAWLAYMFSTIRGEVGRNMAPVREGFAASDAAARAYVTHQRYQYAKVVEGLVYYGRGLVQITWYANYFKFREEVKRRFGVDIVSDPDMVLRPDIAIYLMFEGMIRGVYTGKKLLDYFNGAIFDWVNARRIINGTDKASFFGNMGQRFYAAILAALSDAKTAPKAVVDNVTSRERNTVKVGTGAGGATAITEATQGFGWVSYGVIAACVALVCVGAYLAYRKRTKLQEAWAKL